MALQQIDAKMLSKMFLAGAKNLENKKEWINELNVFPVPDGDTGTNMTMTIMSAAREVSALGEDADMAALCKAISSGSLRGARGNIFSVGYTLDNTVFFTELLDLKTAQILRWGSVDGIQIAVLFLVLGDLLVDMLQNFYRKCTVFHQ